MGYKNGELHCDMRDDCTAPVTHIDEKGFGYCHTHGIERKDYMRCRQLRPAELKQLRLGKPLARY
jgi:hypothetical protein